MIPWAKEVGDFRIITKKRVFLFRGTVIMRLLDHFPIFLSAFLFYFFFFYLAPDFFSGLVLSICVDGFDKQPGARLDPQARHHILRGLVVSGCICRFYAFGVGAGEAEGSARGLDDVLGSELRTVELPMRVTEKVRKKLLYVIRKRGVLL